MITSLLALALSTYPPEFTRLHNAEREDGKLADVSGIVNTPKSADFIKIEKDGSVKLMVNEE